MRHGARRVSLIHLGIAGVCGLWVAGFGWPEPVAAAVSAPLSFLGVMLLLRWHRSGILVVLCASFAALLAGAQWGELDMMLPLAIALYTTGRIWRGLWPSIGVIALASLSCALREGFEFGKLALMATIFTCTWGFGVLVRHRAIRARRAISTAHVLAAENPEATAARLAAEDRERLEGRAASALRVAIVQMQDAARLAVERRDPPSVRQVHSRGAEAVAELRELLDLLRETPAGAGAGATGAGGSEPSAQFAAGRPAPTWRISLVQVLVFASLFTISLAVVPGAERGPGLALLYASMIVAIGVHRVAPLAACLVAGAASLGAAALPAPPEDALLPVAAGYALIAWSISRTSSPSSGNLTQPPRAGARVTRIAGLPRSLRRWFGLTCMMLSGLVLSLSYGHQGSGFVLLVFVTALLAGIAWREQDGILRGAELRSEHLQARIDLAAEEAVRLERLRLARELHDVASHSVGGMVMQAGAASAAIEESPGEAVEALRTVIDTGDRALAEVAVLSRTLSGADDGFESGRWGSVELKAGLSGIVEDARARGTRVHVRVGELTDSPRVIELLFRVVREGVTNSERHAPGSRIDVVLECAGGICVARVEDDGRSTPQHMSGAIRHGSGYGIAGLAERVKAFGGSLSAGPLDERLDGGPGFRLEARLPVGADEGAGR